MRRRLGALLRSPRAVWIVPLIGCLLVASSLTNGLDFDDFLHRFRAQGAFGHDLGARLDLFSFWPRDAAGAALFKDIGYTPWFASPDLKVAFYRPISALFAFFDYNVLDGLPWLMHLESVAIYGVLVALVAALYRRLLPAPIAVLAALLYAIDDAHGYPVGWLANRNSLLATAFGVTAWLLHDRWRRDRWRAGAVLGPLAFLASLLSAEFGVGALGYLVAHALFLDERSSSRLRRLLAIVPYLAVLVAWQLAYRKAGFGTHGSGWYIDPVGEAGHFLRVAPERALVTVLGALTGPPGEIYALGNAQARLAIVVLATLVLAAIAWIVVPIVRGDRRLRFFVAGSALALVPVLPAIPSDRLLFFVSIGLFPLIAKVLGDFGAAVASGPRRERLLRRVWIFAHLVLAPLLLPVGSIVPGLLERQGEAGAVGLAQLPDQTGKLLVVVNMPNAFAGVPIIFGSGRSAPQRTRILATAGHAVQVRRADERTLELTLDQGENVSALLTLFRPENAPVRAGETFAVPHMQVEVTRVDADGTPRVASFRFERPLEDGAFVWAAWNGQRLVSFAPPAVGATVTVGPR